MATNYALDAYETTIQRQDTNSDASGKMWNGYSDGPNQENYVKFFQTFNNYDTNAWTVTNTGSSTQTLGTEAGGSLIITTTTAANDGSNLLQGKGSTGTAGTWVYPQANKLIYFETKLLVDAPTKVFAFAGLSATDTSITASAPSDLIGFLKATSTGTEFTPTTRGSSTSTTTVGAVNITTGYQKFGIKITGLTKVEYFVNDLLIATHTNNIPTAGLRPALELLTGETVAHTMTVKYIKVAAQV